MSLSIGNSVAAVACHIAQNKRRAVHKDSAHQRQQDNRENEHHHLGGLGHILTHQFRHPHAAVPDGHHAHHVVVHGTGENAAQHNPQIAGRAEFSSHDGAEDGPRARNVEELHHEHPPGRHTDKVYAVRLGKGRGGPTRIRAEHPVHEGTVNDVAQDKGKNAK